MTSWRVLKRAFYPDLLDSGILPDMELWKGDENVLSCIFKTILKVLLDFSFWKLSSLKEDSSIYIGYSPLSVLLTDSSVLICLCFECARSEGQCFLFLFSWNDFMLLLERMKGTKGSGWLGHVEQQSNLWICRWGRLQSTLQTSWELMVGKYAVLCPRLDVAWEWVSLIVLSYR